MTDTTSSARRRKWPRTLVRVRRVWFAVVEILSFFGTAAGAIGSFAMGRWPEPVDPSGSGRRRRALF